MKKWLIFSILAVSSILWWSIAAPREEIRCCVAGSITINPATAQEMDAVDRSDDFASSLESISLELPAYDDAVFLREGNVALVTAHDGKNLARKFGRQYSRTFG